MKRRVKIAVFLLIILIASNINMALDDKHFLQMEIREIEAIGEWIKVGTFNSYARNEIFFTYQPEKYNYRVVAHNFACPICNRLGVFIATESNVNLFDMYSYYQGEIRDVNEIFNTYLTKDVTYKIRYSTVNSSKSCSCGGTDVTPSGGYLDLQVQLKNNSPTLTITAPSPNSPLQRIMIKK